MDSFLFVCIFIEKKKKFLSMTLLLDCTLLQLHFELITTTINNFGKKKKKKKIALGGLHLQRT